MPGQSFRPASLHAAAEAGTETDQRAVFAFLADPITYGGKERVEKFDTHGNVVFAAGTDAFKIKRAVRFEYMDFSTLEKRRLACHREVQLNQRWAADLYLGCVPIRRSTAGTLSFEDQGDIVEWAVRMRRFDQADLLSTRAARGDIDAELATALAYAVFSSHQMADPVTRSSGVTAYQELVGTIVGALRETQLFSKFDTEQLTAGLERQIQVAAHIIDERAREGFVRRCHGDLHLANIVMWHGRPVLYDAIEFNEALATIDTLYDLAFLLMDLEFRNLRSAANVVLNRYLWRSGDDRDLRGLAGLPLFLGLRAAIRARVTLDRAAQKPEQEQGSDLALARVYFAAALAYVQPTAPQLIVVAGLSGSGKTTLAAALAPGIGNAPGAVHLRSDIERKTLVGVPEHEHLPDASYTPEARRRVYEALHHKAKLILGTQQSVVIDAVYDSERDRHDVETLAQSLGVPFRAFWLHADAQVLLARVATRQGDASDANAAVVQVQLSTNLGQFSPAWTIVEAGGNVQETNVRVLSLLRAAAQ